MGETEPKLVDNPATNPTRASERRFAVAIHEAGHAVAYARLGFEVSHVEMGEQADPGGRTLSGDFVWADRTDFLAPLHAGDIAVEELCGGYRLPVVASPNSDQEQLREFERQLSATAHEKARAQDKARVIVQSCRQHIIDVANALLASPNGHLEGPDLEALLTAVRKKQGR